jgi:hypothetical protein
VNIHEEDAIMSRIKTILILAVLAVATAASIPALAHGGRARVGFGFYFGGPAWYYPPPYYYYPPVVAVPSEPTVYVERGNSYSPPEQSQGYWYFCPETKTYYPYVSQCAKGWQKVSPTPTDR